MRLIQKRLSAVCRIGLVCLSIVFLGGCFSFGRGESTADLEVVRDFDLGRYMGDWHEVARLPNGFQKGMTHVTASYRYRESLGRVDVVNRGLLAGQVTSASAVAYLKGEASRGELRVSFFRPFYADYRIFYLDEGYQVAVVGGQTRDLLWILARQPVLPKSERDRLVVMIRAWRYPIDQLIWAVSGGSTNECECVHE